MLKHTGDSELDKMIKHQFLVLKDMIKAGLIEGEYKFTLVVRPVDKVAVAFYMGNDTAEVAAKTLQTLVEAQANNEIKTDA